MKLFWGESCPDQAVFCCRSFLGETFFSGMPTRVSLPAPQTMKASKCTFLPEKEEWVSMVQKALDAIQAGKIEKVVLGRTVLLELPEIPDPFAITAALQKKSKGATLFCLQNGEQAFLGATPEKLFSRRGSLLKTEAMAGTRWKGAALFGEKELRELTPIQTYLQNALLPICEGPISFSPIQIHRTHYVQHLRSIAKGKLLPDVTDFQIADCLHPTPALCGTPQKEALKWIEDLEPFKRDLYGGILGWSEGNTSEFVVAIRCCWIEGKKAQLYTGVGIVAGSNPDIEWEELNQKLKLYEGILL